MAQMEMIAAQIAELENHPEAAHVANEKFLKEIKNIVLQVENIEISLLQVLLNRKSDLSKYDFDSAISRVRDLTKMLGIHNSQHATDFIRAHFMKDRSVVRSRVFSKRALERKEVSEPISELMQMGHMVELEGEHILTEEGVRFLKAMITPRTRWQSVADWIGRAWFDILLGMIGFTFAAVMEDVIQDTFAQLRIAAGLD